MHDSAVACPKCGAPRLQPSKVSTTTIVLSYIAAIFLPLIGMIMGIYVMVKGKFGTGTGVLLTSFLVMLLQAVIIIAAVGYLGTSVSQSFSRVGSQVNHGERQ